MSDEVVTAAPAPASAIDRVMDLRLPSWASIVFGAILLLLVLGALGRPSVFADTASYMFSGRDAWKSVAAPFHPSPPTKPVSVAFARAGQFDESSGITVLSSRRPWYGIFAWPIERVGSLWLLAAVQSGLAAWLIWLSWRVLAPEAPRWTAYAAQGVPAVFSTLPFIAGFAMPDVFASFMIIAATLLLVAGGRLNRNERTALLAITCFSTMAHSANVLVAAAMIALAGTMALGSPAAHAKLVTAISTLILALGLGIGANLLFDVKINIIYHQPPGRAPFLAARLIADGPGRIYLRKACAHAEPYLLCRHKAKPLNDIQAILWSTDEAQGVFTVSSPADRIVLQRQEGRFVIGAILNDPAGVAASVAANWVKLLGKVYVEAPLVNQRLYFGRPEYYPPEPPRTNELYLPTWNAEFYRKSALPGMIRRLGDCTSTEPACQPRLTIEDAIPMQIAEFLIACIALAAIALRKRRLPRNDGLWLRALGFVTFAVVVNALICGAISGPFARYQSAVAWLAVMMAAVGACSVVPRRPDRLS
jgi:hypothetical protein